MVPPTQLSKTIEVELSKYRKIKYRSIGAIGPLSYIYRKGAIELSDRGSAGDTIDNRHPFSRATIEVSHRVKVGI